VLVIDSLAWSHSALRLVCELITGEHPEHLAA